MHAAARSAPNAALKATDGIAIVRTKRLRTLSRNTLKTDCWPYNEAILVGVGVTVATVIIDDLDDDRDPNSRCFYFDVAPSCSWIILTLSRPIPPREVKYSRSRSSVS